MNLTERYAYCESSRATTRSRVHIRLLGEGEEMRVGGGITGLPLCGTDLRSGWDIPGAVSERLVIKALGAEVAPQCPECAEAWADATGGSL